MRGIDFGLVRCTQGDFAACGRRVTFWTARKSPKNRWGRGRRALRAHRTAFPRPRLRGTRTCQVLQYFRRAKSEWLSAVPSGPLGPGFPKIAVDAVPIPRLVWPSGRRLVQIPAGGPNWKDFLETRRGGACPSRRVSPHNLSPAVDKGAFKKGSAGPSMTDKPAAAKDEA